jgi:hypothetical protein
MHRFCPQSLSITNRISARDSLRFRETGFRGPETTRSKYPLGENLSPQRRHPFNRARQLRGLCESPGNLAFRQSTWWAREDSNLQPSGYERTMLSRKANDYWHFAPIRYRLLAVGQGVLLVAYWSTQTIQEDRTGFEPDSLPDDPVRRHYCAESIAQCICRRIRQRCDRSFVVRRSRLWHDLER